MESLSRSSEALALFRRPNTTQTLALCFHEFARFVRLLRPFLPEGGPVLDREAYRTKALHCLHAVHKARDPGERLTLLSLASKYMRLADYVDRWHAHPEHRSDRDQDR
jgi:hypothetical protein